MTHTDLMHGLDFDGETVTGWIFQEKFDGFRALWTGRELVSRNGNAFSAPAWFTAGLPAGVPLDGELFAGRGELTTVQSLLRRADAGNGWRALRFVVFDAPAVSGGYLARHAAATAATQPARHAQAAPVRRMESLPALRSELAALKSDGGEGFMLRNPAAPYVAGRSEGLLKFKRAPF